MTTVPATLPDAEWLRRPGGRAVFAALSADGEEEARVIGGAVRNALMGRPVTEVDFATTASPDKVAALAEAAGIRAVPTGFEHGTMTLVVDGEGFEVTTLRQDIETDGRHAVVRFGRDWDADARRRDFTVNALSVDGAGRVFDPLGGYDDIRAGRIRFIGDAATRIAEDRLRILRFFRFHAEIGEGAIDADGLSAAIRGRDGLRALSAERVGQEMGRLVVADGAPPTLVLMQDSGILPIVLGGVGYLPAFARIATFEAAIGANPAVARRLAALGCRVEEDALRIADRLRLANAVRDRILAALAVARMLVPTPADRGARAILYRHRAEAYGDGVALAFAWGQAPIDDPPWRDLYRLPDRWPVPVFPLRGADIVGPSSLRGPAVGTLLRAVEAWWIDQDFTPDEAALRARLQGMIAAQQ
jgi:tRNA nucleotidyltransferase/poly(A) polymerase